MPNPKDAELVEAGKRGIRSYLDKFGWHRMARERAVQGLAKAVIAVVRPLIERALLEEMREWCKDICTVHTATAIPNLFAKETRNIDL